MLNAPESNWNGLNGIHSINMTRQVYGSLQKYRISILISRSETEFHGISRNLETTHDPKPFSHLEFSCFSLFQWIPHSILYKTKVWSDVSLKGSIVEITA